MTKEITVKDFQETPIHGVNKAGAWTLYNVIADDGVKYGTFESYYRDYVGKKIIVDVEEKEGKKINPATNKPYKNWYIIEKKKSKDGGIWSAQLVEKLFTKLDKIEGMIANLELVDPSDNVIVPDGEIKPEDIPF